MNKIRRIFDIAKELNISHIEIIDFLAKKDIKVTLMSVITNAHYSDILENFQQEKTQVDRLRKEKARLNVIHHNQEQEHIVDQESKNKEDKKDEEEVSDLEIEKKIDKKTDKELEITEEVLDSSVNKKEDKVILEHTVTQKKTETKPASKESRKLKKIDISSIIDKINITKKKNDSNSTNKVKTSVSQLSKKVVKKKKNKKEEIEKPKRETGGGPRRDPRGKRSRAPQTK